MPCTRCGLELPQEARFCSRCGAAVTFSQQQPQQAPEPAPAQPSGYGNVYGAGPSVGYGAAYGPGYSYGAPGFGPGIPDTNRVSRHVQTLALMWGVFAGYRFLTKFFGLTMFHSWARHSHLVSWSPGGDWTSWWMPFAMMSLLFWCALGALTAYGLSSRQQWARGLALVCGVWALIHPLVGTALGIYTLWVLAPSLSGAEYDRLSRPTQS